MQCGFKPSPRGSMGITLFWEQCKFFLKYISPRDLGLLCFPDRMGTWQGDPAMTLSAITLLTGAPGL